MVAGLCEGSDDLELKRKKLMLAVMTASIHYRVGTTTLPAVPRGFRSSAIGAPVEQGSPARVASVFLGMHRYTIDTADRRSRAAVWTCRPGNSCDARGEAGPSEQMANQLCYLG